MDDRHMDPLTALHIPAPLWDAMQADVQARSPEEACGLVAGTDRLAQNVIPVANVLHSPVRYRMDPQAQIDAFLALEAQGQELLAIYHSHPAGPETPSPTDIAEAYYPDSLYLIWSTAAAGWRCRGFQIVRGAVTEIEVVRGSGEQPTRPAGV
jgi:proteasome lid subunit RPN8/RPN11